MNGAIANGEDSIPGTGDVITYEVTITNTGTTCLYQLALADTLNTEMVCQPAYIGKFPVLVGMRVTCNVREHT